MKFYRSLGKIEALSFDLDDTLYSNKPVMIATEASMITYFELLLLPHLTHAITANNKPLVFNFHFWKPFRQQVLQDNPALCHDVTALRFATYQLGMQALGIKPKKINDLVEQAMAEFLTQRCNFTVPHSSHNLLAELAKKVPLVAITNGNVDMKIIGIDHYFQHAFLAGNGRISKPDNEMFHRASNALNIPCKHILHIGDCGKADIFGGIRAGLQTAWLSTYTVGKPLTVLPHVEIQDITEIQHLV